MKNLVCAILLLLCLFLCGCQEERSEGSIGGADGPTSITVTEKGEPAMYQQISQQEAKNIMDSKEPYTLLDVREQEEYDQSHIPGAILIPHTNIREDAPYLLPDKDALILVYCRSGRRSKIAAESLAQMGYTNVKEFGGIIDWNYEIIEEG